MSKNRMSNCSLRSDSTSSASPTCTSMRSATPACLKYRRASSAFLRLPSVFGRKKYYSLVLNMPNLTSATGSWIVRFAELKQSDNKVVIAAPVAVSKVDPAYPAEAMRDNVEGTVTLYAVIHIDGTVSGIKVVNSVDPRLDEAERKRAA